jgi:hypothetical protein
VLKIKKKINQENNSQDADEYCCQRDTLREEASHNSARRYKMTARTFRNFPCWPTRLPLEQKDHRGYEDKVRINMPE